MMKLNGIESLTVDGIIIRYYTAAFFSVQSAIIEPLSSALNYE